VFKKILSHITTILLIGCCLLACNTDRFKSKGKAVEVPPVENKATNITVQPGQQLIKGIELDYSNLEGRRMVITNKAAWSEIIDHVPAGQSKKIWVNTCINKFGKVKFVEPDKLNTNVEDNDIIQKAIKLVAYSMFEKSKENTEEQCGIVKLNIDKTNIQLK